MRVLSRATPTALRRARRLLAERAGLALDEGRDEAIASALESLADDLGHAGPDDLLDACERRGDALLALACRLRVGETHFFRTRPHFEALAHVARTRLVEGGRLRCWSAGCSTGEETWSAAVALAEAAAAAGAGLARLDGAVLGTDLDAASLIHAAAGEYGEYSFRGVDAAERERWFEGSGDGRWSVRAEVRPLVRFARHDLVRDEIPEAARDADVILCRHVLMYLTPEAARGVLEKLVRALAPGGWLIVGAAEHGLVADLPLDACARPGCIVYRKRDEAVAAPLAVVPGPHAAAEAGARWGEAATRDARPSATADVATAADPAAAALLRLEADPGDAEACLLLGRLAADRGRAREAEAWLLRAAGLRASCAESRYLLGVLARSGGRPADALRHATDAVRAQPSCVMALELLARLRREAGDARGAAEAAAAALRGLEGLPGGAVVPLSGEMTVAQVRSLLGAPRHAAPRRGRRP